MTTERIRSRPLQVLAAIWIALSLIPIGICVNAMIGATAAVTLVALSVLAVNVIIGIVLVRLARTGIDLDSRGVVVRNLMQTERVRWAEISGVGRDRVEGLPEAARSDQPVRIHRYAGSDVVVGGLLVTKSEKSRRAIEALVVYLNQRLEASRSALGPT
ncbi:MAG: hypothetical protein ACLPQS_04545 [Acidimicrobiales bacterium]